MKVDAGEIMTIEYKSHGEAFCEDGHFLVTVGTRDTGESLYLAAEEDDNSGYKITCARNGEIIGAMGTQRSKFWVFVQTQNPLDIPPPFSHIPKGAMDPSGPLYWLKIWPERDPDLGIFFDREFLDSLSELDRICHNRIERPTSEVPDGDILELTRDLYADLHNSVRMDISESDEETEIDSESLHSRELIHFEDTATSESGYRLGQTSMEPGTLGNLKEHKDSQENLANKHLKLDSQSPEGPPNSALAISTASGSETGSITGEHQHILEELLKLREKVACHEAELQNYRTLWMNLVFMVLVSIVLL